MRCVEVAWEKRRAAISLPADRHHLSTDEGDLRRQRQVLRADVVSALAGRAVTPPAARIAAAAVVAALNASLLEWAVGTDPDLDSALEHVFRVLEGRDD